MGERIPQPVSAPPDVLRLMQTASLRWQTTALGERVMACPRGSEEVLVKSNPLRRVYRFRLAGPVEDCAEVYLKLFNESALLSRLKRLLRGPAARVEWRQARRAIAAGVVAPLPLAYGVGRWGSCLLTASCQPAENLNGWLDQHPWDEQVGELLVELLLSAHAASLLHDDLHAGNILYRPGGDGLVGRMWLLDLQKVRFRRPLSVGQIVANLAPLAAGLSAWLSAEQVAQFLGDYRQRADASESPAGSGRSALRPGVLPEAERFVAAVRTAASRHEARLRRSRIRGILRTSRYFARVRLAGGWTGQVFLLRRRQWISPGSLAGAATFRADEWQAALAEVVGQASRKGNQVDQAAPSGPIRQTLQVGPHRLAVSIEHFRGGGRDRPARWKFGPAMLAGWFGRSPAKRAFRAGHIALLRGESAPLPLACLERRVGGLLRESLLICEGVAEPHLKGATP